MDYWHEFRILTIVDSGFPKVDSRFVVVNSGFPIVNSRFVLVDFGFLLVNLADSRISLHRANVVIAYLVPSCKNSY